MPKCRLCGKQIDKNDAFCAPTGGGRFYYCSKEEYDMKELTKQQKPESKKIHTPKKIDLVYEEIADIFEYRIQNSALWKEIKLWRGICDDKKILAYLQEHKDYIKNAVGRLNSNEYARIRYVSAILKNSLKDYSEKTVIAEPVKIEVNCEVYEPTASSKKRRRGLSAIEDEV